MIREQLEELGVTPPGNHPGNGEPFVSFNLDRKREVQEHHYLPPTYPERTYATEYDDDGPIAWHTRTDEEMTEALEAYEKARTEWRRTGGRAFTAGPETVSARFETASGAWAEGIYAGTEWRWVEWSTGPASQHKGTAK